MQKGGEAMEISVLDQLMEIKEKNGSLDGIQVRVVLCSGLWKTITVLSPRISEDGDYIYGEHFKAPFRCISRIEQISNDADL